VRCGEVVPMNPFYTQGMAGAVNFRIRAAGGAEWILA
jgi:hypothetical protein